MSDPRIDAVQAAGIVGLGGAGFPTHIKLLKPVDTLLINAAECEPLLRKDNVVMQNFAAEIADGIRIVADLLQVSQVIVGIKAKNKASIAAMEAVSTGPNGEIIFSIGQLADFYPAGDEVTLVHELTRRVVPPAGLPLDVGVVVMNNETVMCIAEAQSGKAMTETFVTVSGEVKKPATFRVPIGTPLSALIEAAGGTSLKNYAILEGGPMMGKVHLDPSKPIVKTSSGVIVLPESHPFVERELLPRESKYRIGKSVCDQCSLCTQMCPRYLLGHPLEPHRVMRQQFIVEFPTHSRWGQVCCECGLCSLYACPEGLFPREACQDSKRNLAAMNEPYIATPHQDPHPMESERRVPTKRLLKRIGLSRFEHDADLAPFQFDGTLTLLLNQHIGHPAVSLVEVGETVKAGQLLAAPPEGKLGALLHAPRAGRIEAVKEMEILLK